MNPDISDHFNIPYEAFFSNGFVNSGEFRILKSGKASSDNFQEYNGYVYPKKISAREKYSPLHNYANEEQTGGSNQVPPNEFYRGFSPLLTPRPPKDLSSDQTIETARGSMDIMQSTDSPGNNDSGAETSDRKVTDHRGVFLLVSVILLNLFIPIYAYEKTGNFLFLQKLVSSEGTTCGYKEASATPYLYFPLDPTAGREYNILYSSSVCVKNCPDEDAVKNKKIIPITNFEITRSSRGIASSIVEYSINSFVYSTLLFQNKYCFPKDIALARQLLRKFIFKDAMFILRDIGSSLIIGFPIILLTSLISIILCQIILLMLGRLSASFVIPLISLGVTLTSLIFGVLLLSEASSYINSNVNESYLNEDYKTSDAPRYPKEINSTIILGVSILLFSCIFSVATLKNHRAISATCKVLDMTFRIAPVSRFFKVPTILSFVSFLMACFTLLTTCSLMSSKAGINFKDITPLSPQLSGGIRIFPKTGMNCMASASSFFIIIALLSLCWFHEVLLSLAKFCACYLGATFYYTHDKTYDNHDSTQFGEKFSLSLDIVSLLVGLRYHLGSFSISAFQTFVLKIPYTLFTWIRPRYLWNRFHFHHRIHRFLNFYNSNGFLEIALNATSFEDSMRKSNQRINSSSSVVAKLIDAGNLGATNVGSYLVLTSGLLAFGIVKNSREYTSVTSAYFIPSVSLLCAVSMIFTYKIVSPFLESYATLTNSLLYCHILETEKPYGICDGEPVYKLNTPLPLRKLIDLEYRDHTCRR